LDRSTERFGASMSISNAGIVGNDKNGIWTTPNGSVHAWGKAAIDPSPYLAARDRAVAVATKAKANVKAAGPAKAKAKVELSEPYRHPGPIKPSKDPALQTVALLEAAKALGVDSIKLMQMIAAGDVRTATVGDDEVISRREIDRVLAARESRQQEAKALLNPERDDHILDLVRNAGSGTEDESAELAALIGGDVESARTAARRRART
jgi:hypothetical protein